MTEIVIAWGKYIQICVQFMLSANTMTIITVTSVLLLLFEISASLESGPIIKHGNCSYSVFSRNRVTFKEKKLSNNTTKNKTGLLNENTTVNHEKFLNSSDGSQTERESFHYNQNNMEDPVIRQLTLDLTMNKNKKNTDKPFSPTSPLSTKKETVLGSYSEKDRPTTRDISPQNFSDKETKSSRSRWGSTENRDNVKIIEREHGDLGRNNSERELVTMKPKPRRDNSDLILAIVLIISLATCLPIICVAIFTLRRNNILNISIINNSNITDTDFGFPITNAETARPI